MKRFSKKLVAVLVAVAIPIAGCSSPKTSEAPSPSNSTANMQSTADNTSSPTAAVAASSSAGPASSGVAAIDVQPASKRYKIGVTHYGLDNEFTVMVSDAQKAEAAKLGVDIDIFNGNYDVSTQISQFENMISQKYDAIIFSPVDIDALSKEVTVAKNAGIPVFGVNTRVNSNDLTSYVGSNDVDAGEIEMTQMAKLLNGKGNIVIIDGPIGSSAQIQRSEGINNVLKSYPDIKVLAEKTANWSRDEGLNLMENWLQGFSGKIDGVVSQNDEMALGAINALNNAKLKDKIPVVGVDGIADGLKSIKDGVLDASVFQDAKAQGTMSVDVAVSYLEGKQVEKEYMIPFQLITKDNVDDFITKTSTK